MHWFQKAVWMDAKDAYTRQELDDLALEYICRNDEELMEAKAAAFNGSTTIKRIAPTSQVGINLANRVHDQEQYTNVAFKVPDLTNAKVVRSLKDWKTGNVDQMQNIKTILLGNKDAVQEGKLILMENS
eukprot:763670-Hanusia_phi.AAC.9